MATTKTRQSGVELLRILAMCLVIVMHYDSANVMKATMSGSQNLVLMFFTGIAACAVDVYVMISGFFLSSSEKRSFSKIAALIIQVIIFHVVWYLFDVFTGVYQFSARTFISKLVPNNYFVILYMAVYIMSPYFNRAFRGLNDRQWDKLIITALVLFSVWPTLVSLSQEVIDTEWDGLSTVTRWGSAHGFNVVNFSLVYLVGAYVRHRFPGKIKSTRLLACAGCVVLVIFAWAFSHRFLADYGMRSAWEYHNPLVILLAALLLKLFSQLSLQSKWINGLSAASFTVFLMNMRCLKLAGVDWAVSSGTLVMTLHLLLIPAVIYLAVWPVYALYHYTVDRLLQPLYRWLDQKVDISL